MSSAPTWRLPLSLSLLGFVTLSCGGSDGAPASGGSSNGGHPASGGGAQPSGGSVGVGGNTGIGGNAGSTADCTAVCAHVKTLCADNSSIDDTWLDVCKSACDIRVQVAPDSAELEQACVMAAADCSAAVSCAASPH
ncbi:MAG TPA: hypothetical protein VER96_01645 [Polyangiaceae bacterium]|nr:hypothetical protein [Polyangiaceae bacterium]